MPTLSRLNPPLFQTDSNALSKLIVQILERFGVLSSEQIHQLVSCYAPFGLVGPNGLIKGSVSSALNYLMLTEHKISNELSIHILEINSWKQAFQGDENGFIRTLKK